MYIVGRAPMKEHHKDRLPLVADLLMDAAHADRHLAGDEKATVRKLLPHAIPGMEMDRIELPPGGRMPGVPHTPGTREYLACERGELALTVAGETWPLRPGDVLAFRGDQRHSYANAGNGTAVGYSVVVLAPAS